MVSTSPTAAEKRKPTSRLLSEKSIKTVVLKGPGVAGLMLHPRDDLQGCEVRRLQPDGNAARAGICEGDVILFINGQDTGERRVAVSLLAKHHNADAGYTSIVELLPAATAAEAALPATPSGADRSQRLAVAVQRSLDEGGTLSESSSASSEGSTSNSAAVQRARAANKDKAKAGRGCQVPTILKPERRSSRRKLLQQMSCGSQTELQSIFNSAS